MAQPVTIENDAARLEVWPHIGGKVSSLVDKADRFELLFAYPAEIPTAPQYDQPYQNSWYQGWDECFPAVAPGPYPAHPYQGVAIPDHGELFGLPTHSVPSTNGITTVWNGLRFGYELTRVLHLEGPTIIANYSLQNLAPFPFRFVWAQHALLSLAGSPEIQFDPGTEFRFSHDQNGTDVQKGFDWPNVMGDLDLSRPDSLPAKQGWKVFSAFPIAGPAMVRYPARGRSLKIEFASEDPLNAYWGLWVNTGGWAGHRHFAIEPTTGRFDQLDRAVRDSSAGKLPGSAKVAWTTRWTLV